MNKSDRRASGTQVVLLGTGTPNAEPERSGPSVALVVDGRPYIVDVGPGVVRRARAAHGAGVGGLAVEGLSRAFVTHLHSDHTAGLPDLILTPWVLERDEALHVFGPPGIRAMTDHLLAAYEEDIQERVRGLEPANETGFAVLAHEIEAGPIYQDSSVCVEAFPVRHGSWPAFGFKFTTAQGSVVLSGDTAPAETLVEHARGCDLLVHEVYSAVGFQGLSPAWQRYHRQVHTSTHELAEIASRARPGLLVTYHLLFWGIPEDDALCEITSRYDGPVALGRDLDCYEIGCRSTAAQAARSRSSERACAAMDTRSLQGASALDCSQRTPKEKP